MYTGKHFRLRVETLGIETAGENRHAVQVPGGSVVKVLGGPRPDDRRMVDVLWNGKVLVMFAEDIRQRGEETTAQSARS